MMPSPGMAHPYTGERDIGGVRPVFLSSRAGTAAPGGDRGVAFTDGWAAGALAVTGLTAVACTSAPAAAPSANGTHRASTAPVSHGPVTPTGPASPVPPSPTAASPAPHVIVSRVRAADGSVVTVAAFRGPVQYVLHNGSEDPGAAAGLVRAAAAVTGAERQHLLAAFNGGFKLSAGAGGYEQEGRVIAALRPGLASLVIDRSGQARIGIWGASVPAPGEAVYSVRQNLAPLVYRGNRPVRRPIRVCGAPPSAVARSWPAAPSPRTLTVISCSRGACPRRPPTWRRP